MICRKAEFGAQRSISATQVAGIFLRHDDAGLQPRLGRDPLVDLPAVDRARQFGGEVLVLLLHAAARERDQHAGLHAVRIEMLRAHQVEVRPGRTAVRRDRHRRAGPRPSCADGSAGRSSPGGHARRRSWRVRASAPTDTAQDSPATCASDECRNRRWQAVAEAICPGRARSPGLLRLRVRRLDVIYASRAGGDRFRAHCR